MVITTFSCYCFSVSLWEMDPVNQNQSQPQPENPSGLAEVLTPTPAVVPGTEAPASDPSASAPAPQLSVPVRPRRPQRTPRIEGSVDICDPKPDPPEANQDRSTTHDAPAGASHPKPLQPEAAKPHGGHGGATETTLNVGPKVPGHPPGARSPISMRAASVPQPPSSRSIPPHLNPHAQRAFSVSGTADTQAQVVEDFR